MNQRKSGMPPSAAAVVGASGRADHDDVIEVPLLPEPGGCQPEQKSSGMSRWKLFGLFVANAAICSFLGGFAGYYSAIQAPVPAQVMVLDLDSVMKEAAQAASKNPKENPKVIAEQYVDKTKAQLARLATLGVVVIDRAAVVSMPPGALITMEGIENASNTVPAKP